MPSLVNECYFNATSAGTGSFVVASAVTGYYTPAQLTNPVIANAVTYHYRAESSDLTEYESGIGTYTVGTVTLARTTVLQSSNAGAAVNFTAAPRVRLVALAQNFPVTSAELATVISDETGTGALVFGTSPTLVTPNIGAAVGTVSGGNNAGMYQFTVSV